MDRFVPPSAPPMAHGLPGSPGAACTELFFPLRYDPNRMDRWEVEDIKAHFRDFGKNAFAVRKCADGTRKHFVPRAESRANRIDSYAQFFVDGAVVRSAYSAASVASCSLTIPGWRSSAATLELPRICSERPFGSCFEQWHTDLQIDCDILIRFQSLLEIVIPGQERINPAGNGVKVLPQSFDRELPTPMIIAKRLHGDFAPLLIIFMPVSHNHSDSIVAVCEDVRMDFHRFAYGSLDGKPPTFHFGMNASNDDALRRLITHNKSLTRRRRDE